MGDDNLIAIGSGPSGRLEPDGPDGPGVSGVLEPSQEAGRVRRIPADFDPRDLARVDACLAETAARHGVTPLWAIESGSRAWGFPSPDSDFDCRFVYRGPPDRYLALWPPRDVVEAPLDGDLDVNGWDIGKALRLMLKGNAVVIEWLMSPIVYAGDLAIRDALLAFVGRHVDRVLIARHYLHLGERQRRVYLADRLDVPLKKVFYVLRPAAALRWLRLHPARTVAPMHFPTLLEECDPPPGVFDAATALIRLKALTREMGTGEMPAVLGDFIAQEFELARPFDGPAAPVPSEAARREAEHLFRAIVRAG